MNRRQRRAHWRLGAVPASAASSIGRAGAPAIAAINLRIGELALHGFDRNQGRHIADVFQQSLSAALDVHGLPPPWTTSVHTTRADGGTLQFSDRTNAQRIGAELARCVLGCRMNPRR